MLHFLKQIVGPLNCGGRKCGSDSAAVKRIEEGKSGNFEFARDEVLVFPWESLAPISRGNAFVHVPFL